MRILSPSISPISTMPVQHWAGDKKISIFEHLGGEFWIEPDGPGTGTCFEFSLPVRAPA